ncbi:hypothetical protein RB595_002260 [Gaeumannomyces hyphopodioides]
MDIVKKFSKVVQGAFAPKDTMKTKPPAAPMHEQNRFETPRPIGAQLDEPQRPRARGGDQYSGGKFAPISQAGGRTSVDSSTERDSPATPRKSSQPTVGLPEFRSVVQKNGTASKSRPRRAPGQSQQSSHAPRSSPKHLLTTIRNARAVEDIDDDDDVLLLHEPPPNQEPRHGTARNSEQVDLTQEYKAPRQELVIDIPAERLPADRLNRKRAKADSPDELNDDDYQPEQQTKRPRRTHPATPRAGKSSSLSTKGDIGSTFAPRRGTGPNTSDRDLSQFRLMAAVCPPRFICDNALILVPRQNGLGVLDPTQPDNLDAPMDNQGQRAPRYELLQISPATTNRLSYSPCRQYVTIDRPMVKDSGGKLHLKFSSLQDGVNFVAWAEQQIEAKAKPPIQEVLNTKRHFEMARNQVKNYAESRQSKEQPTHISKADGMKPSIIDSVLVEINLKREGAKTGTPICGAELAQPPSAKKRLREGMVDDVVATGGDADVREVKRPNIERRSTRSVPAPSAIVAINSKIESSPPPLPWTLEHSGWDKEWRMPLTYHRTTIHKEDVARLDDGEFLNDSIISFYINYLHNRLKATDKDAAARFYFHNSFFYERLKPAKGKAINYDNVKSWTSRVDIFKYDFIVVPVNENSHWWVAVICNPGKLAPDEPASATEVYMTNSVVEPRTGARDDSESAERFSKDLPELPKKSSKDRSVPSSSSPCMSPGTTCVREQMRSMSLSQRDAATPAKQTPILIDDEPDNQVVIPDDDAPDPPLVVSDIPSPSKKKKESSQARESPQAQQPAPPTGKEPRVITLDSLGSAHSPACTHLKQYLCEELLDKKKQQVIMPSTFGLTAKAIPLQSNYWDCGAYLLSYIDFLMKDPDASIKAILEKRSPGWCVDASKIRSEIRDVIIKEHAAYQKKEEATAKAKQENKRLRKERAAASSVAGSSPAQPISEAVPLPSSPPGAAAPSVKAAASPADVVRPSIECSNPSVGEIVATS